MKEVLMSDDSDSSEYEPNFLFYFELETYLRWLLERIREAEKNGNSSMALAFRQAADQVKERLETNSVQERREIRELAQRAVHLNQKPQKTKRSHAQEERHAANREEVLGAALAVLAAYPKECTDARNGKIAANKIADKIDDQGHKFWNGGDMPLKKETVTEHIRKWLRKTVGEE
jgi:hypothetical protein